MKKIFFGVIVCLMAVFSLTAFAEDTPKKISVYCDGRFVDFDHVEPQIINGRTMVPIRAIFEEMGATVKWKSLERTAECTKGDTVIKMVVDSDVMTVNGNTVKMDVAPTVINGRTLAPAKYVAEALGASVLWSHKTKNVVICSDGVFAYADYPDIPDFGKCYGISPTAENETITRKTYSYAYSDLQNYFKHNSVFESCVKKLGKYIIEKNIISDTESTLTYTKEGASSPRFVITTKTGDDDVLYFDFVIPFE